MYFAVSVHDDKEFVPLNHSPGESCTEEGQIEIQMEDLEEGDGDGPHLHPEVLRKGSQLPVINKEMLKNLNRSISNLKLLPKVVWICFQKHKLF